MEDMTLEEIAVRYYDGYYVKYGIRPTEIFLSKQVLEKYEKELGVYKIDTVFGMKVKSHTWSKYSDIVIKTFNMKVKDILNKLFTLIQ